MGRVCVYMDKEFITNLFAKGFNLINGKMKNWPDDAEFVGVNFDAYGGGADFVFKSKDFTTAKVGERYQRATIMFRQKSEVTKIEAELEGVK